MRIFASSALALIVAGCGFNAAGVGVVAPADVRAYYQETAADVGDMTAGEYLVASIAFTNQNCHEFFDKLAKLKEDSDFIDQVITAGIAAGAPLAAAYSVGTSTIASWAAGAGLANELQKDAANIYLFAEFKEELKPLVFREMQSYLVQSKLAGILDVTIGFRNVKQLAAAEQVGEPDAVERFLNSQRTDALIVSRNMANDYAAKCSLSNMRTLISDSLRKNGGDQNDVNSKNGKDDALKGGALAPSTAAEVVTE